MSTGGDDNLGVVVARYDPPYVHCYGEADRSITKSCYNILDSIPAGPEVLAFTSNPASRSTAVKLPFRRTSCKFRQDLCKDV